MNDVINVVSGLSVVLLSIVVNILLTPLIVHEFGLEGLGVLRVALTIPLLVTLFSMAVLGALSRYYSVSYHAGRVEEARQYISTAFFSLTVLSGFPLLVLLLILCFGFIHESVGREIELYSHMAFYSFCLILTTVLVTPAYARNKVYYYNLTRVISVGFPVLMILIFLQYWDQEFSTIGWAYSITGVVTLVVSFIFYLRVVEFDYLSVGLFKLRQLKQMMFFGRWVVVDNLGIYLCYSFVLVLTSKYLGDRGAGEYSIFMQVVMLLLTLSKSICNSLSPKLLAAYPHQSSSGFKKLFFGFSEVSVSITLFCSVVLYTIHDEIFSIWIPNVDVDSWFISKAVLLYSFTLVFSFLPTVYLLVEKVVWPAIVSFLVGAGLSSFIVFFHNGKDVEFYIFCFLGFVIVKDLIFSCFFIRLYLNVDCVTLLGRFSILMAYALVFLLVSRLILYGFHPESIWGLFLYGAFCFSVSLGAVTLLRRGGLGEYWWGGYAQNKR